MKGDFTRNTFDPAKHFSRVLMQQGRVTLDADQNEQAAIQLHYLRTLARDLIGPYAAPVEKPAVSCSRPTRNGVFTISRPLLRRWNSGRERHGTALTKRSPIFPCLPMTRCSRKDRKTEASQTSGSISTSGSGTSRRSRTIRFAKRRWRSRYLHARESLWQIKALPLSRN